MREKELIKKLRDAGFFIGGVCINEVYDNELHHESIDIAYILDGTVHQAKLSFWKHSKDILDDERVLDATLECNDIKTTDDESDKKKELLRIVLEINTLTKDTR